MSSLSHYHPFIAPKEIASQVKGAAFSKAFSSIPVNLLKLTSIDHEQQFTPTDMDRVLKNRLWLEIFKRFGNPSKIDSKVVYQGVCTYTHWYNNILGTPSRLAWLLAPANCLHELIEIHCHLALAEAREIMKMDNLQNGKAQNSVMKAKIKIFEALSTARNNFL